MSKLRAAIIGLGHQAKEDHIPGIMDSQFAELKAICDVNKEKLKYWQEKLLVNAYSDFKELFASEGLDFVIVAVPHNVYKEVIGEAIKHGVHVLKEKPFAMNLKEGLYLKSLCDNAGVHLMTTSQRRFNPIYTAFFQLIDQIGAPFFIDAKYTLFVDNPHEGWRGNKKIAGGGCIMDMGYHMIDMLVWYFGLPEKILALSSCKAKPDEVYDAEDTACILFSYNNDLHGSMTLSRFYPPKTEKITIIGSRGMIEVSRGSIKKFRSNGELAESLVRENAWPAAATNQIDFFCNVIVGKKENVGSPNYHLQHLSFIEACYLSQKEGRAVNPQKLLERNK